MSNDPFNQLNTFISTSIKPKGWVIFKNLNQTIDDFKIFPVTINKSEGVGILTSFTFVDKSKKSPYNGRDYEWLICATETQANEIILSRINDSINFLNEYKKYLEDRCK